MTRRHAIAAILALALLAGCQGGEPPAAAETGRDVGAPAAEPDPERATDPVAADEAKPRTLVVTTLGGDRYDLADRRGRWVVVNFWATWCAPCLEEMPELSALHAMRAHVEVIGLAYEDTDADTLRAFLAERPVAYPVAIVGTYDPPRDFPTPRGLPLTCLVAPDGRLVRTFLGPVTALELEQAIEAAGGPAPGQGA